MCADNREETRYKSRKGFLYGTRNWGGPWPKTPGRLLGIGLIRFYQFAFSPIFGSSCRHLPTCSEYGYEAIARHGLIAGGSITFWRVMKCNPLGKAGIDPVPVKMKWQKKSEIKSSNDC